MFGLFLSFLPYFLLRLFSKNGNQLSGEQRTPDKKDKNKMSQRSRQKPLLSLN
jgi:hypothetical protein